MTVLCAHVWVDLTEKPDERKPYDPWLATGTGPRQMKPGHTYTCRGCGATINMPKEAEAT